MNYSSSSVPSSPIASSRYTSDEAMSATGARGAGGVSPTQDTTNSSAYHRSSQPNRQPTQNAGGVSSVGTMMRQVPVQQTFTGPASTFINVFQQPGRYNIDVNFRDGGYNNRTSQSNSFHRATQ